MTGYQRTRRYREAHPEACERERRRNAARQRALVELSRLYPDAFQGLYSRELTAAGLTQPDDEGGHAAPDWLWTILLVVCIFLLLDRLGLLR